MDHKPDLANSKILDTSFFFKEKQNKLMLHGKNKMCVYKIFKRNLKSKISSIRYENE